MSTQTVSQLLETAINGAQLTQFREDNKLIEVVLRGPPREREHLELLGSLAVPMQSGGNVLGLSASALRLGIAKLVPAAGLTPSRWQSYINRSGTPSIATPVLPSAVQARSTKVATATAGSRASVSASPRAASSRWRTPRWRTAPAHPGRGPRRHSLFS